MRDETVLRWGRAGDRACRNVIARTCASVRNEHAGANGAMRMLCNHEDVSSAAAECWTTCRWGTAIAAIRRNDRSGAAQIAGAGADHSVGLARVPYSATRGPFSIAAGALLHVSHLIRRR